MADQYAYGYIDNPLNPTGTPDYFWELANPDDGLAALYLTPSTIPENSIAGTVVGAILGKTSGSTLAFTNDAGGRFALSGTNIVATATPPLDHETAASHVVTLRETHAPATNSPRDTTLTITVTDVVEAAPPGPFTLAWTSAASELTNLTFSLTPAPLVGDVVTLTLDNNADMSSPFDTSDPNTIDAGEAGSGTLTFTGIATPLSAGLTYARVTVVRGIYTVDSNIVPKTLTGGSAAVILATDVGLVQDAGYVSTYTHTGKDIGAASPTRVVAVYAAANQVGDTTNTMTGISVGGVALTSRHTFNGGGIGVSLFSGTVPTGTTADIVLTSASYLYHNAIAVLAMNGVSAVPADVAAHASVTSAGSPYEAAPPLTVPAGGFGVGLVFSDKNPTTWVAPMTLVEPASTAGHVASIAKTETAATITPAVTAANFATIGVIAAAWGA